ncbi:MAG: hypothetical protein NC033_05455 [Clostridiales bacterium]|nr:hypothetical protein [Clostridiales bacterium]
MEEICTKLSALLCDAGMGGYKVFYEEELSDCLPENMRNRDTLEAALKNLDGGGYIDVKYARGNTFCIACLKKYEAPEPEPVPEPAAESVSRALPKAAYIALALSAFLGGAVGGCIAAVLGAVL